MCIINMQTEEWFIGCHFGIRYIKEQYDTKIINIAQVEKGRDCKNLTKLTFQAFAHRQSE